MYGQRQAQTSGRHIMQIVVSRAVMSFVRFFFLFRRFYCMYIMYGNCGSVWPCVQVCAWCTCFVAPNLCYAFQKCAQTFKEKFKMMYTRRCHAAFFFSFFFSQTTEFEPRIVCIGKCMAHHTSYPCFRQLHWEFAFLGQSVDIERQSEWIII